MFSFLKKKLFFESWEQNWSTEIHAHGWQRILWLPVILGKKGEFLTFFVAQIGPQELF